MSEKIPFFVYDKEKNALLLLIIDTPRNNKGYIREIEDEKVEKYEQNIV
ncbi:hypothetical protein GOV05_00445 [Candidatus Woesearchaeota archaeon]|nr:hypothetical protein [Candidatus Woesearchaeota archaeon]